MSRAGGTDQRANRPLISIVIPVFDVENYLDGCLTSVLQQDFRDIEVIAIDGGSGDLSGDILDKRAAEDTRLTVSHVGRIGPGLARNAGFERASGEYVWFVDGDDLVPAGSLRAIADRLAQIRPDILFVDHVLCTTDGRLTPGHDHVRLGGATTAAFTLAEQPWVIELSLASWNKIYRHEFFRDADQPFSKDWPHEDVPVSCLLPLAARRLGVLNQVCYRYHKNRPGSAMMAGTAQRHFRIFDAYETILEQVEKRLVDYDVALSARIYAAYFERAIWHFTNIFDTGRLVAHPHRRPYFTKMHDNYLHFMPSDYRPCPGPRGAKFRLIERNAYRTYALLAPLNSLRVKARRAVRPGT
jgi:CDP-glycerol glycerophosphotransferase